MYHATPPPRSGHWVGSPFSVVPTNGGVANRGKSTCYVCDDQAPTVILDFTLLVGPGRPWSGLVGPGRPWSALVGNSRL